MILLLKRWLLKWRESVFWRVAGILLAVQLLAVMVAVALSAWAAYDRAMDLASEGLRLRLDVLAEEVEARTDWSDGGLAAPPTPLLRDLSARFPDPVVLVDASGQVILAARPDGSIDTLGADIQVPRDLVSALAGGSIVLSRNRDWMAAPVFDDVGFQAGSVLLKPIRKSLMRELQPAWTALIRALLISGLVVLVLALALAASFTWRLVGPLREMTAQVEAIGQGDYGQRVEFAGSDELGRLGNTINQMAIQVARSIDELQATDRLRRELVANVGHDLRTPLTALRGRVDESRRKLAEGNSDEAVRQLESAQQQASFLTRLVDDLFELAILDTPSPPLRLEPVPIGELVRDAASQYRDGLARRRVSLRLEIAPGLPTIRADGLRLIRLLNNLLSNADRHTPDEGAITLSARQVDDLVEIRVRDNGEGLDPERIESLFERYYRGSDARTRSSQGAGLGLSISKAIATAHGGRIGAVNLAEGGAEFTLTLPVGDPLLPEESLDQSE